MDCCENDEGVKYDSANLMGSLILDGNRIRAIDQELRDVNFLIIQLHAVILQLQYGAVLKIS